MTGLQRIIETLRTLTPEALAKSIDSTLLSPTSRPEEAVRLVEEAAIHGFWCAMVPPSLAEHAARTAEDLGVRLCSVAGFPSGMSPAQSKVVEIEHLASVGVEEVDIVPSLASGGDIAILVDKAREAGIKVVKVIVEAPLQDEHSLRALVEEAARAGADYVKTSTGVYSKGGDYHTVYRLYQLAEPLGLKVKAAGGIRDGIQAALAIAAGASRIGTSSGVKVLDSYRSLVGQS